MCTVSYLPLSDNGFIITSTRDEKTLRKPANPPQKHEVHGQQIFFPQDQDASGTWFATGPGIDTLCLLNGGFVIHEHIPPYRKSRGLVLLDYYKYNDTDSYRDSYDFSGIEPFTLLIAGGNRLFLDELRWDGQKIHHRSCLANLPAIWSSVTLYSAEVIKQRNNWFDLWLDETSEFTTDSIVNFHKTAGTGDVKNDILMNRENAIRSVSITSLTRQAGKHIFHYEDMIVQESYACAVE
jgi:predicted nucleic acid binding AN1-type Zn finger protein